MKLELSQKLQQQQILAPQMILSMDVLLLSTADLEQRIEREFMENPALEISEKLGRADDKSKTTEATSNAGESLFSKLDHFQGSDHSSYSSGSLRRRREASDAKHESLQNTEGRPPGLKDYLSQQLRLLSLQEKIEEVGEVLINSLDHRGYLLSPAEDLFASFGGSLERADFDAGLAALRSLDPPGVGAENLQQCLMLQLERDPQNYPLEAEIISRHLLDLGQNKLPKIAKELNATLDDLKDAVDIISALDPLPGARYESEPTVYVRPDVLVEEVDDELRVTVNDGHLPTIAVSDSCRQLLKSARGDRDVCSFLRKKIESAQWLVQAVQQRQRTLRDIAVAMVEHQRDFMLHGPEHLKALKMQTLADHVKVHISTVSRAIKGKYIQTPYGLFDLRYFFTGGVGNADGELESRRNVYRRIQEIIAAENKRKPYSDTQIAKLLQEKGLQIARRTVTKYRESQGVPSSRLRRAY